MKIGKVRDRIGSKVGFKVSSRFGDYSNYLNVDSESEKGNPTPLGICEAKSGTVELVVGASKYFTFQDYDITLVG